MNRDKLTCICPVCGYEFWACKSIAQEMGALECGHGSCPGCNTFHNLTVVMGKDYDLSPLQEFLEILRQQRGVESQADSAWYRKMVSQCALCKEEKQKKQMIALLARGKRGSGAKQLAYVCWECYEMLCDNLGVTPPELEF